MEQLLINYGPVGLLAMFIVYVLKEFKSFVKDEVDRCEARFKDLWEAYQDLAMKVKGDSTNG